MAPYTAGTNQTISSIGATTTDIYREIQELIKPGSPEIDLTKMTMHTWNQKLHSQADSRKTDKKSLSVKLKLSDRLWTIKPK